MIPWYWMIPGCFTTFAFAMSLREPTDGGDYAAMEIGLRLAFWGFLASGVWGMFFLLLWMFGG
jgi:hypothetical protein